MEVNLLALVLIFVFIGATVKGLAGFGFGILGTALLANFIPGQEAVTLMILPLLAVNIPLILQADIRGLKQCLEKFRLYILMSLTGTLAGVAVVGIIPENILAVIVGIAAIIYLYLKLDLYIPEILVKKCFRTEWYNQLVIGAVSGLAFGASNIGLMFVTYLEGIEVDRETFIGLLSLLIFSATVLRIAASANSGLYTTELLNISLLAAALGLGVSEISAKIAHRIPDKVLNTGVYLLILFAAARLIALNLF